MSVDDTSFMLGFLWGCGFTAIAYLWAYSLATSIWRLTR